MAGRTEPTIVCPHRKSFVQFKSFLANCVDERHSKLTPTAQIFSITKTCCVFFRSKHLISGPSIPNFIFEKHIYVLGCFEFSFIQINFDDNFIDEIKNLFLQWIIKKSKYRVQFLHSLVYLNPLTWWILGLIWGCGYWLSICYVFKVSSHDPFLLLFTSSTFLNISY